MIKPLKIKGRRYMLLVTNLNIRFQHPPLLHISILIICNSFHKTNWEMHVQNNVNTCFFFAPNRNTFFIFVLQTELVSPDV